MILSSGIKNDLNLKEHFSIEDSIPIVELNESGLLRSINNRYSKSYRLTDINYILNDYEQQRNILDSYKEMLNSFDDTSEFAYTVFNTKLSDTFLDDNVYYKFCGDGYDEYREAFNEVIKKNIVDDKKAFSKEKIITISTEAKSYDNAIKSMKILDEVLQQGLSEIEGASLQEMNATEMLKYLNSIYNIRKKNSYNNKAKIGKKEIETFTMRNAIRQGISAKELVQPTSMKIEKDYIRLGDAYIRCLYIDNINKKINSECINDICSVDFNLLLTTKLRQMDIDKAIRLAKRELANVEGDIANNQSKLAKEGLSVDLVPRDMQQRREEALDANDAINIRDEKFFDFSIYALIFADSKEELKENTEKFKKLAKGKGLYFVIGGNIQENILNSALPYGLNQTIFTRTIDTEGATAFVPFSCQDLMQPGGDYYGVNKLTHNPILYDLMTGDSYSMIIMGESGKGKSFSSKKTIVGRRLKNSFRYSIVIDPNNEWGRAVKSIGGQEVMITAGGNNHINLFDIDSAYGDNPLSDKEDFVILITKLMLHSPFGLSAGQMTTVSKAVNKIYEKWKITNNEEDIPTIEDYHKALLEIANMTKQQEDYELCKTIEFYCGESQNTLFRGKTDINRDISLISYNLQNLGSTLKPLAMQILMDNIWTQVCKNRNKGIPTDLIIDEFHLMFNGEADTAIWMAKFWKMFRKYLGCPVGITQNPEDMLSSEQGRTVLSNTAVNIVLSLKKQDRKIIKDVLSLTEKQETYIDGKNHGEGIIYIQPSKNIKSIMVLPFKDPYPEENLIYKLVNTTYKK